MVTVDRQYSGAAAATIINTAMTPTTPGVGGTIVVADDSGYPSSGKFEIVVDRGLNNEESVLISSRSGTTFTIGQRGYDGTPASSHTSGQATCAAELSGRSVQLFVDHVDDVEADPHSTKLLNNARHDLEARHTFGAALGTPVTPTALTPDIAGAAGTGNNPAREDHVHNVPAAAPGNIQPDDVAAEGAAASFARADHTHGITAAVAGAIQPDDSAAEGAATSFARSDHRHSITAAAPASLTETATNAEGAATSFARSDHAHATDNLPWGVIAQQSLTNNNGPHTTDTLTDMALNNVPVRQGHTYKIHLHSFEGLTAVGNWVLELRVNGSVVDWLDIVRNSGEMVDGSVHWTAPATQATDDFTVFAREASAGGDLTLIGAADHPRKFTITDLGVL